MLEPIESSEFSSHKAKIGEFCQRKFKKTKLYDQQPIKLDSQPTKLEGRPRKLVTVSHKKLYGSKLSGLHTFDDIANSLGQKIWWNQECSHWNVDIN